VEIWWGSGVAAGRNTYSHIAGRTHVRHTPWGIHGGSQWYVSAGDTVALVELTRTGGTVAEQPLRQTVALQAQMLG
jgi:hypothetical protein